MRMYEYSLSIANCLSEQHESDIYTKPLLQQQRMSYA